jgi:predicted component of type VI protein secretion system
MLNFGNLASDQSGGGRENEFRILVLADAMGFDQSFEGEQIDKLRVIKIDRDNLDDVLAQLKPTIEFEDLVPGQSLSQIVFDSIESFHPDEIFKRADVFAHLRKLKRQLRGDLQQQAMEEIRSWNNVNLSADRPQTIPGGKQSAAADPQFSTAGLFDEVLDESYDPGSSGGVEWDQFIDDLLKPIKVQTVDPNVKQYEAIVDRAVEVTMRKILDHSRFKSVEAAWRGMQWLTRRIDSDVQVKVFLMSMSKDALIRELGSPDVLEQTDLFKYIVERTVRTPGGKRWSMVCAHYTLGLSETEILAMGRLGNICAAGGTNLFSCVCNDLDAFENEKYSQRWKELCAIGAATHICAMTPRILLRLPYGKGGTRTEQFAFDEEIKNSNGRLWGNPTILAAAALATDFENNGATDSTQVFRFQNFPMHAYRIPGMEDVMISGERMIIDSEIAGWLALGVTPVISFKDSDRLQIAGFQSIRKQRLP